MDLASSLRLPDGTTPLSARYHLFLRATEGAFTCLSPKGPHVQLARHETCPDCEAPVFEIGSCKRCGAVHVVGTPTPKDGRAAPPPSQGESKGTWLVLDEHEALEDEDEAAVLEDAVDVQADEARLCTGCGVLADAQTKSCPACGSTSLRSVRKLKQKGEEIAGCLVCGARGSGTVEVLRDWRRRQRRGHHDLALPEPAAER